LKSSPFWLGAANAKQFVPRAGSALLVGAISGDVFDIDHPMSPSFNALFV
jgi:hypothetical protein